MIGPAECKLFVCCSKVRWIFRQRSDGLSHSRPDTRKHKPGSANASQLIAGHGPRGVKLWNFDRRLNSKSFCEEIVPIMRRLPVSKRCMPMDSRPSHANSHARSTLAKNRTIAMHLPKSSPALMSWGCSLQQPIYRRIYSPKSNRSEGVKSLQKRLNSVATPTYQSDIKPRMQAMVKNARAALKAKGGHFELSRGFFFRSYVLAFFLLARPVSFRKRVVVYTFARVFAFEKPFWALWFSYPRGAFRTTNSRVVFLGSV